MIIVYNNLIRKPRVMRVYKILVCRATATKGEPWPSLKYEDSGSLFKAQASKCLIVLAPKNIFTLRWPCVTFFLTTSIALAVLETDLMMMSGYFSKKVCKLGKNVQQYKKRISH